MNDKFFCLFKSLDSKLIGKPSEDLLSRFRKHCERDGRLKVFLNVIPLLNDIRILEPIKTMMSYIFQLIKKRLKYWKISFL